MRGEALEQERRRRRRRRRRPATGIAHASGTTTFDGVAAGREDRGDAAAVGRCGRRSRRPGISGSFSAFCEVVVLPCPWVSAKFIPARGRRRRRPRPLRPRDPGSLHHPRGPRGRPIRWIWTARIDGRAYGAGSGRGRRGGPGPGARAYARIPAAMALTAVGSIAFDSVRTPFGERERTLGEVWPSTSRSPPATSSMSRVGVRVGDDFGEEELWASSPTTGSRPPTSSASPAGRRSSGRPLRARHERRPHRRHAAQRLRRLRAEAPATPRRAVPLPRQHPARPPAPVRAQRGRARRARHDELLDHTASPRSRRDRQVDCLLLNDAETRMLTGEPNLAHAARRRWRWGPRRRRQARRVRRDPVHARATPSPPRLPLEEVLDPTGAGDSFAGGFLGYLD